MEANPDLLRLGPEAVLYAIVDSVVDGYAPVVAGLGKDIDEIEFQVFGGEPGVSRRIYELSQEVIDFQRSVHPLIGMLTGLQAGFEQYGTDEELRRYLRDVADHATIVAERVRAAIETMGPIEAGPERVTVSVGVAAHARELAAKEAGRDSIWRFILQNTYRPFFLRNQFDFVIGNPPWLTYSQITVAEYQD